MRRVFLLVGSKRNLLANFAEMGVFSYFVDNFFVKMEKQMYQMEFYSSIIDRRTKEKLFHRLLI